MPWFKNTGVCLGMESITMHYYIKIIKTCNHGLSQWHHTVAQATEWWKSYKITKTLWLVKVRRCYGLVGCLIKSCPQITRLFALYLSTKVLHTQNVCTISEPSTPQFVSKWGQSPSYKLGPWIGPVILKDEVRDVFPTMTFLLAGSPDLLAQFNPPYFASNYFWVQVLSWFHWFSFALLMVHLSHFLL